MLNLISRLVPFSFALASLISVAVVLSGCTSTSSPDDLYFMKINLTGFFEDGSLDLRRSFGTGEPTNDVSSDITTAVGSAADAIQTVSSEISHAAGTAAQAEDRAQKLINSIKPDLPGFYSVGILGYCKGSDSKFEDCSKPNSSFYFDFAGIFENMTPDITDIIPGIENKVLGGYKKASQWSIVGFIIGLVLTVVSILLSFTNLRISLILIALVSTVLITGACIAMTAIYGTLTAAINSVLKPFGAYASLGPRMIAAAWLSAGFSMASTMAWLILTFCCCIR